MAHFAKLDENNIVLEVHIVSNNALDATDEEASGIAFLKEWSGGYELWKQTSYNGTFRRRYAGAGYFYDPVNDVFIAPKPYPSWILDENFDWQPPIPKPVKNPEKNEIWVWHEESQTWIELGEQ